MPRKPKKSDFPGRLAAKVYHLESRLHDTLSRVEHLVRVHEKVYGRRAMKKAAEGDILRSGVVFLHAALEDFLRGISIVYLPDSSSEALDKIPLLGSDSHRPKNFGLGALLVHKHKRVGRLIEQSVAAHLRKSNYNNVSEIDSLLTDCGNSKWPDIKETFPPLGQLMERRHRIVHRSDSTDTRQTGRQKAAPIAMDEVNRWLGAVRKFASAIVEGIITTERTEARKEGYIAYLKTLNAEELGHEIDHHVADRSDRIIDSDEASSAMASTNASGFYVDDYHVTSISIDEAEKQCRIEMTWHSTGESDPDKSYFGDEIAGTAVAILDDEGRLDFEEVSAARVDDDEWEE